MTAAAPGSSPFFSAAALAACVLLACSEAPEPRYAPPPAPPPAPDPLVELIRWSAAGCRSEEECRALNARAIRVGLECRRLPSSHPRGQSACATTTEITNSAAARADWFAQARLAEERRAQAERDAAARQAAEEEARRAAAESERVEAERRAAEKAAAERRGAEEYEQARQRAEDAVAPERSSSEGRVCCCDGTVSPTCTYVKRGCCSHHKGVCPCE